MSDELDFDDILSDIGEFGLFQKLLLWCILLPSFVPCGFHAYNQLFMQLERDHWCTIPELDERNYTWELQKNLAIPYSQRNGKLVYSKCSMYDLNYTEVALERELSGNFSIPNHTRTPITYCRNGFTYNVTGNEIFNSVVSEWSVSCKEDFYPTLALVLFGLSGLIGNYVMGYIQDRQGRRPAYFIFLTIQCIFGLATSLAPNFTIWTLCRIGVGFTIPAIMGTPMVMCVEMVRPERRTFTSLVSNIAYSFCLVLLSFVVWLVRPWRQLALATTLPFLAYFLHWWGMPESPRWLMAHDRFDEAEKIMHRIAKINGVQLPGDYWIKLKRRHMYSKAAKEKHPEYVAGKQRFGVADLFRTPNMAKKTLIITFIWFTNTSVYVGLSYYAPLLGGDEYLNFFLAAAAELPTYFYLFPTMDCWGRRWTLASSMIVGGLACLATFSVQNNYVVTLVLYCIGKFGISSSFVVLPLAASEMYPTVVRGIGLSLSGVAGMLGPVFIPLINYLGGEILVLPLIIMGVLLVIGGLSALALPETLHAKLPETLEEGENFGKDLPWRYVLQCCPPSPESVTASNPHVEEH